jgi:hypothetical protein
MKIYTLENSNIQIDREGNPITNIITPIVVTSDDLVLYPYPVSRAEEMRPDMILNGMYGNTENLDEIMTLNNIVDSWSIREGDILWYPDPSDLDKIRREPVTQTEEEIINQLVDPNSERKVDFNRETGENTIPTVKPTTMQQISVDTTNNTIKIINRLK